MTNKYVKSLPIEDGPFAGLVPEDVLDDSFEIDENGPCKHGCMYVGCPECWADFEESVWMSE